MVSKRVNSATGEIAHGRLQEAVDLLRNLRQDAIDLAIVCLDRESHGLRGTARAPQWLHELMVKIKSSGSLWLCAPNQLAAEYKVLLQDAYGCVCRSWVVWYHGGGVVADEGIQETHSHLLHFVRDAKQFTFNWRDPAIRVPSARELVYADARASSKGRLPDDTWLLAPSYDKDVSPPRPAARRLVLHPMIIDRMVRACSKPGDTVLGLFTEAGVVPEVAKRSRRKVVCDNDGRTKRPAKPKPNLATRLKRATDEDARALLAAFDSASSGWSIDYVVACPETNFGFQIECDRLGVPGLPRDRNLALFRLRKAGRVEKKAMRRYRINPAAFENCAFASEIALSEIGELYGSDVCLDEILATPELAAEFDAIARGYSPGFKSIEYRWAALGLRKRAHEVRISARQLCARLTQQKFERSRGLTKIDRIAASAGLYVLRGPSRHALFVGATPNLRARLRLHADLASSEAWSRWHIETFASLAVESKRDAVALLPLKIAAERPKLNSNLWLSSAAESAA